MFYMDKQAHDTAAGTCVVGHDWQGVSLQRALLLSLYVVMRLYC